MKICPNCGYQNDDKAAVCEQCHFAFNPKAKRGASAHISEQSSDEPLQPVRLVRPTPLWKKINWKKIAMLLVVLLLLAAAVVVGRTVIQRRQKVSLYEDAKKQIAIGAYEQAAQSLEKAVSLGNPDAAYLLGQFYLDGTGVSVDAEKGDALRRQAYENGSDLACYGFAMEDLRAYVESGSITDLQACLAKLEKSSSADALYQRSLLERVAGNIEGADELLQKAVNAGSLNATCDMAQYLLYSGDNESALALLQEYPYQEEPSIQASIAWIRMHNGESSSWQVMQQLSNAGCGLADAFLGDVFYDGLVPGQERDFNVAYNYYKKSSEEGCVRGSIGMAMTLNVNPEISEEELYQMAVRLYRQGYVNAGAIIGDMMIAGRGVKQDPTGLQYIIASANNCYAPAELYMASYYYKENDMAKCKEYLQRAYNHDSRSSANICAAAYLGDSYTMGPDTLY